MIGDRIKEIRKIKKMNQIEFGEKIGVKQSSMASYENGSRQPVDAVIRSICREFNVNESWLRTGEGNPFVEKDRDQQIEEMVDEIMVEKPEDFRRRFVRALAALDADGWAALERFIDSISEMSKKDEQAVAVPPLRDREGRKEEGRL